MVHLLMALLGLLTSPSLECVLDELNRVLMFARSLFAVVIDRLSVCLTFRPATVTVC